MSDKMEDHCKEKGKEAIKNGDIKKALAFADGQRHYEDQKKKKQIKNRTKWGKNRF